jgi:hypothetical protein
MERRIKKGCLFSLWQLKEDALEPELQDPGHGTHPASLISVSEKNFVVKIQELAAPHST